jgi:hypothetical protein
MASATSRGVQNRDQLGDRFIRVSTNLKVFGDNRTDLTQRGKN